MSVWKEREDLPNGKQPSEISMRAKKEHTDRVIGNPRALKVDDLSESPLRLPLEILERQAATLTGDDLPA